MKPGGIFSKYFGKYYNFIIVLLISGIMYAQDISDNNYLNDEYHIFGGMAEGITIYEGRPRDFAPESIEGSILHALNGSLADRKNIIENELLGNAGFRRTGNLKYRKTEPSEKTMSVLHAAAHAFSFGIIPMKPFFEIDYARLPDGVYYSFNSVISSSELIDISPEILSVVEIEYMLQIEFCNGILIKNNINYYSEKNINKFEKLILNLPEYPESIRQLKERYLNIELPKIRRSLYRYNNPSEDYLRALENLGGSFNINRKK